jgi:hypothetical protein
MQARCLLRIITLTKHPACTQSSTVPPGDLPEGAGAPASVWSFLGSLPKDGEIVTSNGRLMVSEGPFEGTANISDLWVDHRDPQLIVASKKRDTVKAQKIDEFVSRGFDWFEVQS